MKKYYIFRHGETFATKQNSWYFHKIYSVPILEEGKPIITKMAQYLKDVPSDHNVCSPFLRCRQTAEIVTDITGKVFEIDNRLKEYTWELPYYFKKRVINFINEMEKSEFETILVCTHSLVIEMMVQYLTQGKMRFRDRLKAPLPGVLNIIINGKLEEIDFNKAF